jgi:hypothetical protein
MADFDKIQALATNNPFTKPTPEQLESTLKKIKQEHAISEQLGTYDPEVVQAMAKKLDEDDDGQGSSGSASAELKPSFSTPFGPGM